MKRRSFLKSGSVLSLPVMLSGMRVGAMTHTVLDEIISADSDRVFVLIRQNGGNDGLSTVIPLDQYDNLSRFRSELLIPEGQVLKLTEETGLHPVMPGLHTLYQENVISIVQNVGYPNQNRSHFRSTDIWDSGSEASEVLATGWIGRYLDTDHPGFPEGYPNAENPHPIAITMGPRVSETCQGMAANFSLAISDPTALAMIPGTEGGDPPDLPYGHELSYLRQVVSQTNQYAGILQEASEAGTNQSDLYPEPGQNSLADQLKIVAQLISGGLETKVYVVNLNGFDTHANQIIGGDPTVGVHSTLLANLSTAIHAFMDDLRQQGLDERVIGATRSEFGRQIAANGSLGTDHGEAAPLIVFGSCVNGGLVGTNPVIPDTLERQQGVQTQVDFKNVFGSLLMDWFGASESIIQSIFSHQFEYIPMVEGCSNTTSTREEIISTTTFRAFPNPFFDELRVSWDSPGGPYIMSLYNSSGQEVRKLERGQASAGQIDRSFSLPTLPPGHYIFKLQGNNFMESRALIHF